MSAAQAAMLAVAVLILALQAAGTMDGVVVPGIRFALQMGSITTIAFVGAVYVNDPKEGAAKDQAMGIMEHINNEAKRKGSGPPTKID